MRERFPHCARIQIGGLMGKARGIDQNQTSGGEKGGEFVRMQNFGAADFPRIY